jgi:hypothetical protein
LRPSGSPNRTIITSAEPHLLEGEVAHQVSSKNSKEWKDIYGQKFIYVEIHKEKLTFSGICFYYTPMHCKLGAGTFPPSMESGNSSTC